MERLNKFENEKSERVYGQLAISAGLCLFSELEKDVGHRYVPLVFPPVPEEFATDNILRPTVESLHVLHLLNWFALFLAQSSCDSTAVAMVKKDNALLIYVSIDKDTVDESDRQRAKSLLSCVYQAIGHGETGALIAENTKRDNLIRSLVDHCWPIISHRLRELKAAFEPSGGVNALLHVWPHKPEHQANKPDTHLQVQLSTLSTMVVPKPLEGTRETRFQCLTTALDACEALVNQYSVPRADDDTWFFGLENAAYRALDQIFQHIRYIYDYRLTTTGFLAGGVDFLREHVGKPSNEKMLQEHMKIVWVRDTPNFSISSTHKWDLSPKEWIDAIIKDYSGPSPGLISHPRDKAHQLDLTNHCTNYWTKGSTIPARIHPGIELLFFLEERNLAAVCDVMGTNSELCCTCSIYFEGLREEQDKQWLTRSGCPNKIERNWLLPPVNRNHCVGKNDWARHIALQTGSGIRLRTGSSIDAYLKKTYSN